MAIGRSDDRSFGRREGSDGGDGQTDEHSNKLRFLLFSKYFIAHHRTAYLF